MKKNASASGESHPSQREASRRENSGAGAGHSSLDPVPRWIAKDLVLQEPMKEEEARKFIARLQSLISGPGETVLESPAFELPFVAEHLGINRHLPARYTTNGAIT